MSLSLPAPVPIEPTNMAELERFAERAAKSGFFGAKDPNQALMLAMAGRDLGLSYTQALRAFHVIEGKPVLSADGMVAVCVTRRDLCRYFRTIESTDATCTVETHREGEPEPRKLSFTMAEAKRAGVASKQNWQRYPAQMLRARARSGLARDVYPDLLMGIYDPDEVGADAPEVIEAQVVEPAPAKRTRAAKAIETTERQGKHHPSWLDERAAFCAELGRLGLKYDDVAGWCESIGKPRPSGATPDVRRLLLVAMEPGKPWRLKLAEWVATRDGREPGDETEEGS